MAPGHTLEFTLSATAPAFSVVRLNASLREATPGNPCGVVFPFDLFAEPGEEASEGSGVARFCRKISG